nr:MAG TPA: hypothetical protein [Caudoviricetes sp.]
MKLPSTSLASVSNLQGNKLHAHAYICVCTGISTYTYYLISYEVIEILLTCLLLAKSSQFIECF